MPPLSGGVSGRRHRQVEEQYQQEELDHEHERDQEGIKQEKERHTAALRERAVRNEMTDLREQFFL